MPETAEKPAMPDTLSVEAYVAEVLATLTPLPAVDTPLFAAHGLVLAQDVTAALPVPPWTNSAMDGYAVRARDTESAAPQAPVILPVAGDVPAGTAPAPLVPGTAQRIMTGAMLPENADAVVKVEDTDQAPGPHPPPAEVGIRVAARPGLNVRQAGEDVGIGDSVLTAGTLMTATAVASLASVGLSAVRAFPRPRVAVVSTGAELVEPGQELPAGAIPDSNSLLLAGLVAEHGARLASVSRSVDTAESLATALIEAARGADLIVTSGGVSAGAFDPLVMLAEDDEDGENVENTADGTVRLRLSKVAMQPGKPQGHGVVRIEDGGTHRQVPIITLPGNPVSVLVSFITVVAPALARLAGRDSVPGPLPGSGVRRPHDALSMRARAAAAWRTPPGRRQHIPVRFVQAPARASVEDVEGMEDMENSAPGAAAESTERAECAERTESTGSTASPVLWVEPTHRLGSGSHLVASMAAAEALAVVGEEVAEVAVGDEVGLIALNRTHLH
ncbi:gephyrin-like molybdotransferase Glp [Actinomyces massiliensis]|jgi:molybdopterin biosynthesis protein moeA (fragment)|uniref:molybdopterin molybdotransferase MoeA n=1 Tax=Actinomyces massiliensis TaxID=461393 RepID=UPI0028EA861C|nr:gephyrin-like molybdotransferase Glp [Actinomyces massiliensis]